MKDVRNKIDEVIEMYHMIDSLNIPRDIILEELKPIIDGYIKENKGASGRIKLPVIKAELHYKFSLQPHVKSTVFLRPFKS
jgi:hypothetical protein